jgi:hypothetical protein
LRMAIMGVTCPSSYVISQPTRIRMDFSLAVPCSGIAPARDHV